MGAGYGLIPSTQADPLVDSGRLIDLCPEEAVVVDLYWHHWDLEPPLTHDITALIIKVAHQTLLPTSVSAQAQQAPTLTVSATRLRDTASFVTRQ